MDEKQAVRQTVEAFLRALGRLDIETVKKHLAEDANLVVVRKLEEGFKTSFHTKDDWLAHIAKLDETFEEALDSAEVTIDNGVLAHLRGNFRIIIDGDTVKHGVDYFTLVHEGGAWKIAAIAYTSLIGQPGV